MRNICVQKNRGGERDVENDYSGCRARYLGKNVRHTMTQRRSCAADLLRLRQSSRLHGNSLVPLFRL